MYPASPPRAEPAVKIAVWHNLPSGGGKRALYYHVRGLVERGHTVESWCPPTADLSYLPLRELISEHAVSNLFVNQRRPRERFIVGLGAIVPEKRIALAINAIAEVSEPRPELVWIGNVANPRHLERMQRLARERAVTFRTEVGIPDKDLIDLLNRAAMLVYWPRLEPFGPAPLEANACGLPVVAVAEGGVRETILDSVNGLLVDDDPTALARGIQRLFADPSYALRLGNGGCDLVNQRWPLRASIDRLEQRLSEVVERRSATR